MSHAEDPRRDDDSSSTTLAANEFMTELEYLPPAYALALNKTLSPYEHIAGTFFPTPSRSIGADGRVHGYVLRVHGSTAVDRRESPFVHTKTGTGVSWYAIEPFDNKALNARIKAESAANARAARWPAGASMFTASMHVGWDTRHFLIVHGVDARASAALLDRVEAAVHAGAPLSVAAVADSAEYAAVLAASAAARERLARAYASHHGLVFASGDAAADNGSHTTHSLESSDDASRVLKERVIDVYDDAANTVNAHAGVLVYRGPIGGFTLRRGPQQSSGAGVPSRYFTTSIAAEHASSANVALNVAATTTGHYYEAPEHKLVAAALVRRTPALSAVNVPDEHARRVHAAGVLTGYNPNATRRYNADTDEVARATHRRLGIDALETYELVTLSAELPSLDPLAMNFEQLATAAAVTSAPTIAVPESGRVVKSLVRNWPALAAELQLSSYASALARHHDGIVELDTPIVRAVARIELKATTTTNE